MTAPDTSAPAVEAMIGSELLAERSLNCLYIAVDEQVARDVGTNVRAYIYELKKANAAQAAEIERLTKTIRMSGDSAGEMISALRAELAKMTAKRDDAMAAKKAKHIEMFEATNYYEDLIQEIVSEHDADREALAKAVSEEREACAKVAEGWHVLRDGDMTIAKLAAAIRARKEPTP